MPAQPPCAGPAGVLVPDPALQDSLQRLNEADPLQGEQTWPTAQVRQGLLSCLAPQHCSRPSRAPQSGLSAQLQCSTQTHRSSEHSTHEHGGPGLELLTCLLVGTCWLTVAAGASRCLAAILWRYKLQRSHSLMQQQELHRCLPAAQHPLLRRCGALLCAWLPSYCRSWQILLGLTSRCITLRTEKLTVRSGPADLGVAFVGCRRWKMWRQCQSPLPTGSICPTGRKLSPS